MKNYLNKQNLLALYYTFFYSHILYGILGWGSVSETEIKPIQILQNKVLRIINKSTWKDRVTINALHKSLNILKIADIYNFEVSKFMYLYHTQSLPEIFDPYFLPIEQAHHNIEQSNKLISGVATMHRVLRPCLLIPSSSSFTLASMLQR